MLRFIKKVTSVDQKQNIAGSLQVAIKKIPGLSIEGQAELNLTEHEKTLTKDIELQFFADEILDTAPTTFEESVTAYQDITKKLKNTTNVIAFEITPIHSYCGQEAAILNEIRSDELNRCLFHKICRAIFGNNQDFYAILKSKKYLTC